MLLRGFYTITVLSRAWWRGTEHAMSERERDGPAADRHWTVEQATKRLTRRRLLAGVGAAGASTAAVSVLASDSAAAEVTLGDLEASATTFEAASVEPILDVDVDYEYSVSEVERTRVELLVGGDVIASEAQMTAIVEGSGTTTLSGRVTDSSAWDAADFDAPTNGSVTRELAVEVRFAVLVGGDVTAADTVQAIQPITVDNSGAEPEVSVGGTVTVRTATPSE